MKKRVLLLVALLVSTVFCLFADGFTKPAANQVVVVGRIVATPAINDKFFSKYWDIPLFKDGDKRSEQYAGSVEKSTAMLYFRIPAFEKPLRYYYEYIGTYNSMLIDRPKDNKVIIFSARLYPADLNLFDIFVKINKSFYIPDGAKYVYFGTINVKWSGSYFTVDQVIIEDEFDAALKIIRNRYGNDIDMVKVSLTDEEEKK